MSKFDRDYFDKIERNWAEDAQRRARSRPQREPFRKEIWEGLLVFLAVVAIFVAVALARGTTLW